MAMQGARVILRRITKLAADVVPGYLNVAEPAKGMRPRVLASVDWMLPQ